MRRSYVLATAGHVDHGKSALIRALTGIEPDRWDEERRRGMTLDLGFAWTRLSADPAVGKTAPDGVDIEDADIDVAFVDVPGHERYVPTMLAGAGPVAGVLFVVAADEGWSAQSTEHLHGLRALGVQHGILVISKTDLLEPELAESEARDQLTRAGLGHWPTAAVSARTGEGLDQLRREMRALTDRLPRPDPSADVRLWLDRAFSISGAGTVVTGTLTHGTVRVGGELELVSADDGRTRRVRVRGLQSAGHDRDIATGVARVALNVRGARTDEAPRGSQLLTADAFVLPRHVDVRLEPVAGEIPERLPTHCMAHLGTASLQVRIRPLDERHARLTMQSPVAVRIGDRIVLRDPGRHAVLAAAVVLDPHPVELQRRGAGKARAVALADYPVQPDAGVLLRDKQLIRADDLRRAGCLELPAAPQGWCLDDMYRARLTEQLITLVDADLAADPDSRGLPIGAARHQLTLPHPDIVAELIAGTEALQIADGFIVSDRHAAMSPRAAAALARFADEVRDNPFHAPDVEQLRALDLDSATLAVLTRHGALVDLGRGIYLQSAALPGALQRLGDLEQPFTLSQAREALGTTRRVAVPLMEHLHKTGRTRRVDGDRHTIVHAD